MSIESDTERSGSTPRSCDRDGRALPHSSDKDETSDEMSAEEFADYEAGVRELFEKVPELFVNFKSEDLDPQEFPTDRALEQVVQERGGTDAPRDEQPVDQRTAPQLIPPPSTRQ